MSTLSGVVEKLEIGEKSDKVTIQGKRVVLRKGQGSNLKEGQKVTLNVTENSFNGKKFLNGEIVSTTGSGQHSASVQESIVFQSSLKIAVDFEDRMFKETAGMSEEDAATHRASAMKQLIKTAYSLARLAQNPRLNETKEEREKRVAAYEAKRAAEAGVDINSDEI